MHQIHLFRSSLAIRYDSHLQTLMQLDQYTVHQNRVAPSPMLDALWLPLTFDPSKIHLLAQIMCQSKGQSSAPILKLETPLCLNVNKCYIIENAEELIALLANFKLYYYILWMLINVTVRARGTEER